MAKRAVWNKEFCVGITNKARLYGLYKVFIIGKKANSISHNANHIRPS